jgi:hypothetical protein
MVALCMTPEPVSAAGFRNDFFDIEKGLGA